MSWLEFGTAALSAAGKIGASGANQARQPETLTSGGLFDSSGWNVATGGGALPGDVSRYLPWVVVGVVGLLLFKRGRK